MLDDLKYAIRGFERSKVTALVLLVSLGVGTGANAVLYSVMDALLFRPPRGVVDAARLVTVFTSQANGTLNGLSSYPDFLSLRAESRAFESLAAIDDTADEVVRLGDGSQRVRVAAVSPSFFTTVGVSSHAGRVLTDADGAARVPVAVVSHQLWTLFGSPADVAGKPLLIDGREYAIAGVAARGFQGLQLGRSCDVWVLFGDDDRDRGRGERRLSIIGRLAAGSGLARARQEVEAIGASLADRFPATNRGTLSDPAEARRMTATRYSRLDASSRRQVILISAVVFGATGLLLLSACVNAGSLLLSRSAARRRELAVKVALGANRRLLVRQILVESLFISLSGAAVGLLLAYWTAGILPAHFAPEEAELLDTSLDPMVVIVVIALSCVAGAVFAIGPVRHATQTIDTDVLRADSGIISARAGRRSLRAVIVTLQVALSTVLLVAAGLFSDTLAVALEGDFEADTHGVAMTYVRLPGIRQNDVLRGIRFHNAAEQAALKMPGAVSSGWVATLPMDRHSTQAFQLETATPGITEAVDVDVNVATTGYFHAMRIPLVEGRLFTHEDDALAQPVLIVNDVLARRYLGPGAVGQRLRDSDGTLYEIVGIVRSGKYRTLQDVPEPVAYFALSQRTPEFMHLVVQSVREPAQVLRDVRQGLSRIDAGASLGRETTLPQYLEDALVLDRLLTTVVAACGAAALVLATIGVYGVIDDRVRRRTPEIGLRVALGASNSEIRALVLREGLQLTTAGALIGGALVLLAAQIVRLFLHALPAIRITDLAIVPVALTVVMAAAVALPVRRALRVSPTVALRAEP